ncbi:unnamed protein product [Leuciscus chuanchicus]
MSSRQKNLSRWTPKKHCCAERLNGAEIRIGNFLENNDNNKPICAVIPAVPAGGSYNYSCGGMEGRYVNLIIHGDQKIFKFCEMEVYGEGHRGVSVPKRSSEEGRRAVISVSLPVRRFRAPRCLLFSSDPPRRVVGTKLVRGFPGAGTVLRNRFSSAPSGVRLSEEGRSAASSVVPCRFSVQGTEVSASPYDPPRRGVERSVWLFPAGSPLQGTKVTVQPNPEASLERLVLLVEFLAVWKLLSYISQWVLHTLEKGFRIQFGSRPHIFLEVLPTVVDPRAGSGYGAGSTDTSAKGAIEGVSPPSRQSGFYSRYFIVPKEDEGLRPILDLRQLNSRRFLRFAFGGEAYQYWVLPFGLGLSPRIFTKCVDAALAPLRLQGIRVLYFIDDWLILAQSEQLAVRHRDVVLSHIKRLGLWLNAKKSVLLPAQRTTFLGVLWDSTIMQACLSPARISAILTAVKGIKLGQSLTVKQFQRLLGLMAAASNVITFGLLYMRLLQWLRIKGFSPRGIHFARSRSRGDALPQRSCHINRLEMMAVFRALKYFLPDLRGHHVLVLPENTLMVSYIRADILLRQGLRPGEWGLHPKVVELL